MCRGGGGGLKEGMGQRETERTGGGGGELLDGGGGQESRKRVELIAPFEKKAPTATRYAWRIQAPLVSSISISISSVVHTVSLLSWITRPCVQRLRALLAFLRFAV